jgi:hypothetical protein
LNPAIVIALVDAAIAVVRVVGPIIAGNDPASVEEAISRLEAAKPKTADEIIEKADKGEEL